MIADFSILLIIWLYNNAVTAGHVECTACPMYWFTGKKRIVRYVLFKNQKFKGSSVIIRSDAILELWINYQSSKSVGWVPSLYLTDYRFSNRFAIGEFNFFEIEVCIEPCYEGSDISLISDVLLILDCISYVCKFWK